MGCRANRIEGGMSKVVRGQGGKVVQVGRGEDFGVNEERWSFIGDHE
jgi:hypothetical protein